MSTFPIFHRISGAFLATIVLFFYLLCLKIGLICFTYEIFYQFFFFASKLILIYVEITALALSYHLYNGARHLVRPFGIFHKVISWLHGRRGILFRFSGKIITKALFDLEMGLYLIYIKKRWIFFFFYLLFLTYFILFRVLLPFLALYKGLPLYPCFVITLPGATEPPIVERLSFLNHLLSLREQDPEWVNWMQRELHEMTPDAELSQRINSFISLEECSLTRDAVIENFQHIYYSSGAYPPVKPYILDSCVRLILERRHIDFDGPALEGALHSMMMEQGNSPFFREVLEGNASLIQTVWEETQRREAEGTRLYLEVRELEQRALQLRHQREVLRREIGLRQYRQDIYRRQQGNL